MNKKKDLKIEKERNERKERGLIKIRKGYGIKKERRDKQMRRDERREERKNNGG